MVAALKSGVTYQSHTNYQHLAQKIPVANSSNNPYLSETLSPSPSADANISAADLQAVNGSDPFNHNTPDSSAALKMLNPQAVTAYVNTNHPTTRGWVSGENGEKIPVMNYNEEHVIHALQSTLNNDPNLVLTGGSIDRNSYGNAEPFLGVSKKIPISDGFYIDANLAMVLKQTGENITMGQLAKAYEKKFGKPYAFSGDPNRLVKQETHQLLLVPAIGGGFNHVKKVAGGVVSFGVDVNIHLLCLWVVIKLLIYFPPQRV